MALTSTTHLPQARLALYSLLTVSSLLLLCMSAAVLAYQLAKTEGYNKPVPSLLTAGAVTLLHSLFFAVLSSKPSASTSPSIRHRLQALQLEIPSLCILGLFALASVARLHSSTPGLLSNCGGYFMCVGLQACLALGWLSFLFLALLFTSLLLATLYHQRRSQGASIWKEPFGAFNWAVYDPNAGRMGGIDRGIGSAGGGAVRSGKGEEA
ncbi:hypothetical protein JCM8547_000893 [Rhodosporidiobolus lusitaniae]